MFINSFLFKISHPSCDPRLSMIRENMKGGRKKSCRAKKALWEILILRISQSTKRHRRSHLEHCTLKILFRLYLLRVIHFLDTFKPFLLCYPCNENCRQIACVSNCPILICKVWSFCVENLWVVLPLELLFTYIESNIYFSFFIDVSTF